MPPKIVSKDGFQPTLLGKVLVRERERERERERKKERGREAGRDEEKKKVECIDLPQWVWPRGLVAMLEDMFVDVLMWKLDKCRSDAGEDGKLLCCSRM